MLKEFRTSNLIEMRNELKHCVSLVQNALNLRASMLEYKSDGTLESMRIDSHSDPETYYHFKFLDKACSIVADTCYITDNSHRSKPTERYYYHIKTYYWKSKILESKNLNIPFCSDYDYYGNFSYDEALSYFKRICAELLGVLGVDYQMVLF